MGPGGAKGLPGRRLVRPDPAGPRRARAPREADDGRRGSGAVFGAFRPAAGGAPTAPSRGRAIADRADVLGRVDARLEPAVARVDAVLGDPSTHRALGVLLRAVAHPRRGFVVRPTHAADPNPIAPWWEVLPSPALKGRQFETWDEVCRAVEAATASWNAHRHPFVGGRRKRPRAVRPPGLARPPLAAVTCRTDHLSVLC